MKINALWWSAVAITAVGVVTNASARPPYLQAFKAHYNTASGKPTLNAANCQLCHMGMPNTKMFNPYGMAVRTALGATNVQDREKVIAALVQAEKGRHTGANQTFAQAIAQDRFPGVAPAGGASSPGGGGGAPVSGQWRALYDGVSTNGWTKKNGGNWDVKDYVLRYTGGGKGWLASNDTFTNYSLVVVWKWTNPTPQSDAGIFLGASPDGNPFPTRAIQLSLGPNDDYGRMLGAQGTTSRGDLIKRNDWNVYSMTVQRGMASLNINGTKAWERATGMPTAPGHIGIQVEDFPIEIAQIWIMPLP